MLETENVTPVWTPGLTRLDITSGEDVRMMFVYWPPDEGAARAWIPLLIGAFRLPPGLGVAFTAIDGPKPKDFAPYRMTVRSDRNGVDVFTVDFETNESGAIELAYGLNQNAVLRYETGVADIVKL